MSTLQTAHRGNRRFLVEAAFAPATTKKYTECVTLFLIWCKERRLDPSETADLDSFLTDYIHYLFDSGGGKADARCAYYGIFMFEPGLKDSLPLSALALKGWEHMQPTQSHPPITWDLAVLVAVRMARLGFWAYAVGILLAFDCLLRVGELVSLVTTDVADAGDSRIGKEYKGLALRLRKTKTGPNQWVSVKDPSVSFLLRQLLRSTRRGARIFPFTASDFRQLFKSCCADIGLSERYVPHSLRHGGATRLHLQGISIEEILLRGRWSSSKSARRYVQSGRALLLSVHAPSRVQSLAARLCAYPLLSLLSARYLASLPQKH